MQGFKKVLVALLVVATILGTIGPVFAAPADVAGTKYEDAAVRLMALGVFKGDDKGNFNPDQPITRAEATAIVIRALGLEKSADLMKGVTKFADVNADAGLQWATGAINVAVANGIINGYPDGKFGGRDNVTYAQLAKMVLYALNYGVTVEGGIWPTAVLAKADDLGMLDDLSVVANAPITRGDAAKMLDNSLDVKSLKQTGYGDLKQYEETGATMLEKMNLDEIEGRVVEIPAVASGLDDNEVSLEVTVENGDELDDNEIYTETYKEIEGVDVQGLFGLEVKAWVNDDDEIVFVEKKTSDNDIYTDTIVTETDDIVGTDEVKLDVLDDTVSFDSDATIYVNNKKLSDVFDNDGDFKAGKLEKGLYGRFVEKNNKIIFANLFKFDKVNAGVVTAVDGETIEYFNLSGTDKKLNLADADSVTVYKSDLSSAKFEDITKDDVIYAWADSDDWYIVVADAKAEGEASKIKVDKITINGTAYSFKGGEATWSLDGDDTITGWDGDVDAVDDIDDVAGEDVVALLNLKGDVRHLRATSGQTGGTQYGIVTGAPSDSEVRVFTKDGEEVTYQIDKKSEWDQLDAPTNTKYYGDDDLPLAEGKTVLGYYLLAYELNSDGEVVASNGDDMTGIEYKATVTGNAENADVAEAGKFHEASLSKEDDKDYVFVDTNNDGDWDSGEERYFVDSSTVIMQAVNSDGELDPEVIAWDDFKDITLDNDLAAVYGVNNQDAEFIVFVRKDFSGAKATTYYGVVTDKPWKSGSDWMVQVEVLGEGTTEYVVNETVGGATYTDSSLAKGDVIAFKLNSKGELEVTSWGNQAEVTVTAADDLYITAGGVDLKVDADAVVYDLDSDGALDDQVDATDIEKGCKIYYVEKDGVVKAAVITEYPAD